MDKILDQLKQAALAIKEADALFITAGAGMSTDSGLPDFKHITGFSASYKPKINKAKVEYEAAQSELFEHQPERAWAFYGYQLNLYRKTLPHAGFRKLLKIGKEKEYGYFVFTSNVDGQFQKAGFHDAFLEESNGSMHHLQCIKPCCSAVWDAPNENIIIDREHLKALAPLPKCPHCGNIARPNILMPNDWSWISQRAIEQGNRLQQWIETLDSLEAKLVIIELGANHSNATVRLQSQRVNRSFKSTLIRINTIDYDVPEGGIGLALSSEQGLIKIAEALEW